MLQELIDKICLVNFGPESAPSLSIKPKLQKDLQKLANVVATLSSGGLGIPKAWLYEEFSIPEPKDNEALLGSSKEEEAPIEETNALAKCADSALFRLKAQIDLGDDDRLNEIHDAALAYDYKTATEKAMIQALNSSKNFEQLQKKLAQIALKNPDKEFAQALAVAATKGALLADTGQQDA